MKNLMNLDNQTPRSKNLLPIRYLILPKISKLTVLTSCLMLWMLYAPLSSSAQDMIIGSPVMNPTGTTITVPGNLVINSPGSLNNAGTFVVGGNVVINSGTTLTNTGTITVSGGWTNNGTYSGAGAVQFTGSTSASISGASPTLINNFTLNKGSGITSILDVNGTAAVSCSTLTFTNGLLRINSGGSFSRLAVVNTAIPGTAGVHVNGGTFSTAASVIVTLGSFTVSPGGVANIGAASGNRLEIAGGATLTMLGGNLNIAARLELTGTGSNLNVSGGTISLAVVAHSSANGSLDLPGNSNMNMSNGSIVFQSFNGGGNDVSILAGGAKTMTGGTFQFGNSVTPAASIFKISSAMQVFNVTVNNTNTPQLTIVTALTINGTLAMNGGNINPTATLQVNNTATAAIVRTAGFVNGPLKWQLPSAGVGAYLFPLGKGSSYLPYTITNPTGTTPLVTAEAFNVGSGGSPDNLTVFAISNTEYWLASNTGSFTGGTISLTRPTAVTPNDRIARSATLQAGPYSSINGTPSGNSINGGTTTGLGYFVMAQGCSPALFSACPSNITANTALNLCTAVVSYTATTTGAPVPTLSYTFTGATTGSGSGTGSGSVFNKGTTNVVITATNACGTATCSLSVTVNDNQPPNAICQSSLIVDLNAAGTATITASQINNSSTDNCGVASVTINPSTFNCSNVTTGVAPPPSAWINEFHYDNTGADVGEFVEIAGTAGLNLTGWSIVLYNGADGMSYGTSNLSGIIANQNNGFGFVAVNIAGIQNGNPDGIALVNNGTLVQFLSYGGSFIAGNGVASGQTSVNIGVTEPSTSPVGQSLQLTGNGSSYASFAWVGPATATSGSANNGQTFLGTGNPVILTVTDVNGLSSTCTTLVVVHDVTPPVATCQSITIPLNSSGTATITPAQINNGSSDACGIASMSLSKTTFNCTNVGPNTVTLTVTDVNGLSSTCTATVTVVDNTPPTAICQSSITVNLDATGNASITPADVNLASIDNCGTVNLVSVSPNTFTCADVGSAAPVNDLIISEYVEGSSNNKFLEIYNGTSGAINLGNYRLRLYVNGNSSATGANDVLLSGTLNAGQTIVYKNSLATLSVPGAVNNTAINFNGNDAIALFKISTASNVDIFGRIGNDPVTPWTLGGNITENKTLRRKPTVINGVTVSPTGTGPGAFLTLGTEWDQFNIDDVSGLGSHLFTPPGPTPVTLTINDGNGNTSTCVSLVTVADVTPPNAVCQNITVPLNSNGTVTVNALQVDNGSSDACGIAIRSLSQTNFTCANLGPNPVILTVTDVNGLSSTCPATITITDVTPPVANCQNLTIALDGTGNASITASQINTGSTDACGMNPLMTVTPNTFNCSDITGDPVNDLIISEYIEGNFSNKYIELYNGTAGPINLGDYRLKLYPNGAVAPMNNVLLSGTLAAGQTIVYQNSGATIYSGSATNNTAVNFSGNDAVELFKVSTGTSVDIFGRIGEDPGAAWTSGPISTENMTLRRKSTVTQGVTVNPASGFPTLSTEWDQFPLNYVSGLGAHLLNGGNMVTLTVTDINGNSSTCTAYVTVQDVTAPTLNCPVVGNTNRNTDPGLCTYAAVGAEFNATASDNCNYTLTYQLLGATVGTGTTLAGQVFNKGITLVKWTVSDGVNTPVLCSLTVTVIDNQQPIITCPVAINASRNTNPGQCTYTVVGTEFNATSTDNCAVTSMTYTLGGVTSGSGTSLAGVVFNKGVTSITWTATDGINPAVTCSFTVTVVDAEYPVFTLACPASFAACNAPGISWTPPIASDNCSVVLTSNMSPGDVFPPGTTTVTYSAEDPAGNITTCSFDVTVKEESQDPVSASALPAAICPGDLTTLSVSGGYLGTGANWKWYSGTCGGTLVGIGASVQVSPLTTTMYFVRAEGDCNMTNCVSVSVTVQTPSTDPTSATSNAPVNGICIGGSVILSVSGGSLGTGAVWNWYEDGCGNGGSIGTGSSITITPAFEGLHSYYVRAEGPCDSTNCAAVSVLVGTYSVEASSITSSVAGNSICTGNNITLTVNGGFLGTVAQWKWYSGTCGGVPVGTGDTIIVSPSATTTYFARAEGSCNTTTCVSITVFVSSSAPSQHANIIQSPQSICSGNQGTFTCQTVSNATFYSWSAPNGTTFDGNNPSPYVTTVPTVQVTFGPLPNGVNGYDICVFAGNGCGTSATKCKHVNGRTITPQIITGNASSCPNTSSVYSCSASPGANTYLWTITGNATFTNGNDSIVTNGTSTTVNFGPAWTSGLLSVFAQMSCGYQSPAKTISIISTPVVPGVMSGPTIVCPNTSYGFSIATVAGAVSYNWSTNVPGAIVSPAGTSCSVAFPGVIPAGSTVSVTATGSCGTSAPRVKNITTGMANTPGTISGPAMGQCGQTGVGYSILPVAGATSYLWTTNNGALISGLDNITSVSINFPALFTTCNVNVMAINSCGNSATQTKLVTGAPASPGAITGSGAVCLNSVETYSVVGSTGATQYDWTSPAGSQILTGQNSASIEVLYPVNTGGNISVTASNTCGSSPVVNLPVSVVCRLAQISQGSLIDATLYPNPTMGTTTLKFETITAGDYKVSVVDMTGQVMQTKNVTAVAGLNLHELDLSTYAKGLYMVRLEREGEAMQMLRVTVE